MKKTWQHPNVVTMTSAALEKHIKVAAMSYGDCLFGAFR